MNTQQKWSFLILTTTLLYQSTNLKGVGWGVASVTTMMDEGEANLCSRLKTKQNKNLQKTRKQWFSKHQHEAMRPVIAERWDTDMSSITAPSLLPWESFQVSALKRGTKAEPGRLPNLRRSWEPKRNKAATIHTKSTREERAAHRKKSKSTIYSHVRKLLKAGEKPNRKG